MAKKKVLYNVDEEVAGFIKEMAEDKHISASAMFSILVVNEYKKFQKENKIEKPKKAVTETPKIDIPVSKPTNKTIKDFTPKKVLQEEKVPKQKASVPERKPETDDIDAKIEEYFATLENESTENEDDPEFDEMIQNLLMTGEV